MNYGYARYIWVVILGAAAVAGLIVGGWQAGWWFQNSAANHNYQIQQNGAENQDTLRTQIESNFQLLAQDTRQLSMDAGNSSLVGQDKVEASATASKLCQQGEQVNQAVQYPADIMSWFQTNCSLGVLVPTSQYYISNTP